MTLVAGAPAWAQTDNFNRADAPTLGSDWTQQTGSMGISNNVAVNQATSSIATLNAASSNHIAFDLTASGTSVAAGVFGYGSGQDYYMKLQSSGGLWTTYGFYTGSNSNQNGQGLLSLNDVTSATGHVDFTYDGSNMATIVYTPTGGTAETHTFTYSFAPGSTSDGFGLVNNASIDNFDATALAGTAPEPASWALMILGFGMAGTVLRTRGRRQPSGATVAA